MSERASTHMTVTVGATYVAKAVSMIRRDAEGPSEPLRELTVYEARDFTWRVISEIEQLADLIPLDGYEDEWIERDARRLADRIRSRRLAAKLSNVEGRTPEEAAAFRDKAERLLQR